MKIRDLLVGGVAIVLISAVAYLWLGGENSGLNKAPTVQMTLLNGQRINLVSLRGHPVLINFWATTCPGCVAEMPHLNALYKQLAPQGFELIGVAMYYDPARQVRIMRKALGIAYPITLDSNAHISDAFGKVRLTPTSFLINSEGHIVFQKIGEVNIEKLHMRIARMLAKDASNTAFQYPIPAPAQG